MRICKCEDDVPNHIPEELSAQAKSGRASEKPGVLRSVPSVPAFKLLHPTRLPAPRLGTCWPLPPDETAHGWACSSLADRRAR